MCGDEAGRGRAKPLEMAWAVSGAALTSWTRNVEEEEEEAEGHRRPVWEAQAAAASLAHRSPRGSYLWYSRWAMLGAAASFSERLHQLKRRPTFSPHPRRRRLASRSSSVVSANLSCARLSIHSLHLPNLVSGLVKVAVEA